MSTTIMLTVTGSDPASYSVSYSYGGQTQQPSCVLTHGDVPVDYVFQLDESSITNHWTMTGYISGRDPSPLIFTAGPDNPCTSYAVHDTCASHVPHKWSFQYKNSQTNGSFLSGAELSEVSPSLKIIKDDSVSCGGCHAASCLTEP